MSATPSGLGADGDPALHHLAAAQLRSLPTFIESRPICAAWRPAAWSPAGWIRAPGSGSPRLEAVELAENALRERIERIGAARADVFGLRAPLLRELHDAVRYVRNTARFALHAEAGSVDPMDFFAMASLALQRASEVHRQHLYRAARELLEQRRQAAVRELWSGVAGSAAVCALVGLLFAAMYASIRRAVAELERGSEHFAAGALDTRVNIVSHDELRTVGERFNAMADKITVLIQGQREQARRLKLAASVFASAREGIIITDRKGDIVDVNRSLHQDHRLDARRDRRQEPALCSVGPAGAGLLPGDVGRSGEKGYWEGEVWNRDRQGKEFAADAGDLRGRDSGARSRTTLR